MKNRISEKGITLISIVVTIIILIILAGVSIRLMLGNNGIITKSKEAKIEYEIAQIKEKIGIDIASEQASNEGNISDEKLENILLNYGSLSKEENIKDRTLTTKQEKYEIKVSDIFSGTTVKDNGPVFTKVANSPDINGFDKNNTYYVAWNLNTEQTEYIPDEKKMSENDAPSNWYDYTEGVNHWANIKTIGGGNDCYFVWIPRYAYCISEGYHTSNANTIEVKYLQGTSNTPIDGSNITISNASGSGNWNVPPAFWIDKNNNGVEDKGEQLTGIWVAKFEASSSSVSETTLTSDLNGTGGGDVTNLQVRVKPNVTSWRGINVNHIWEVCQNLTTNGNSLQGTTGLDSHMMKNTEWGAVAYLSRSVYGKNSEVWTNPYYNGTSNYSPITGLCSNETNGKDAGMTDINKTCKYNTVNGGNASTTGNIYGVYDMAGGAWEYVAGVYIGTSSSNLGNNTNRSTLWDSNNSKYVDQYKETTGSQSTYYGNTNLYGDAVYEASSIGESNTGAWDSSYSTFLNSDFPVFTRGGLSYYGNYAGVFAFGCGTGGANTNTSFRPVVICSQM